MTGRSAKIVLGRTFVVASFPLRTPPSPDDLHNIAFARMDRVMGVNGASQKEIAGFAYRVLPRTLTFILRGIRKKDVILPGNSLIQAPLSSCLQPEAMGMFHAGGAYTMSAATTQAVANATSRRAPRYPLAVPVEVTVLRSGIPRSIPGRTLNLGPYGLGLDLAGDVYLGDPVGLEFRLSDGGDALRAKAVVRHQELLRCGLEFLSASPELQILIRGWAREKSEARAESQLPAVSFQSSVNKRGRGVRALSVALAIFVVVGGLGWWQWYRAWDELESGIQSHPPQLQALRTQVPADVMEGLIAHKIEPIYPEDARQAKVQGVVILDTVIGADGSVVELRPVSGPDALAPAAVDAVKWWRFQPYRVNGRPVPVETTISVEFRGN